LPFAIRHVLFQPFPGRHSFLLYRDEMGKTYNSANPQQNGALCFIKTFLVTHPIIVIHTTCIGQIYYSYQGSVFSHLGYRHISARDLFGKGSDNDHILFPSWMH
jgi:hypothetical protein